MGKLEKVIVENGITYVLGDDDIYYPDLQLPEGTNYNIGKFGHMRCEYLKEFKHGYYMELLFDGRLNEYLHEIDEECYEMRDRLVEQMKEKQGVTEKLKAENQMMWVGKMNNLIACAEEIVVSIVVWHKDVLFWTEHLQATLTKSVESLWSCYLMAIKTVYVKLGGTVLDDLNNMSVPNLVKKCIHNIFAESNAFLFAKLIDTVEICLN